jgi:hypothetical protein
VLAKYSQVHRNKYKYADAVPANVQLHSSGRMDPARGTANSAVTSPGRRMPMPTERGCRGIRGRDMGTGSTVSVLVRHWRFYRLGRECEHMDTGCHDTLIETATFFL